MNTYGYGSAIFKTSRKNCFRELLAATLLLMVVTIGACTKSEVADEVPADKVSPSVVSVMPANSTTSVSTLTSLSVTFSEKMDSSAINDKSFTLRRGAAVISGTVKYYGATATFVPSSELESNTVYTGTIKAGVRDIAGNTFESDYTWSFTTGIATDNKAPFVISVVPASNAKSVSTTSLVTVTFNEDVKPESVTSASFSIKKGTTAVIGTINATGSKITFTPSAELAGNTAYTAVVTKEVRDAAGNPMAADYSWSFTTAGTVADVTAPTVSSVTPAANSTGIATSARPSVTFSELIDPATVTTSTFVVKQGSSAVPGTVSLTGNTAVFTPASAFAENTVYTATITTGVKDKAGNAVAVAYTWTFTTVQSTAATGKSFAADVVPVLNQCNTCHRHNWTPSSDPSVFHANLVSGGYINLTTPTSGKIYTKLDGGHPSSVITAEQKATVMTWIKEGSKNN